MFMHLYNFEMYVVQGSGKDAQCLDAKGSTLSMSSWEETQGKTQDTLDRHVSCLPQ